MIANDCIRTMLSVSPEDILYVGDKEDYYEGKAKLTEVVDVVKENNKLIFLTQ